MNLVGTVVLSGEDLLWVQPIGSSAWRDVLEAEHRRMMAVIRGEAADVEQAARNAREAVDGGEA